VTFVDILATHADFALKCYTAVKQ